MPIWTKPLNSISATSLFALSVLCGCGTTGETTRQIVELENLPQRQAVVPIQVDSVLAAPDAAQLHSSGVYKWGKFDASDLAHLRATLDDTLAAATRKVQQDPSDRLHIALVVRKYIVAASNVEGAALAAIDWCIARSDGLPVYREIFYAANRMRFIGTLGMIKDSVHRDAVRRVAESSLALAGQTAGTVTLPRRVPGTFESLEDALAELPESVRSWGAPFVVSRSPMLFGYIPGSARVAVPWKSAEFARAVSCEKLLNESAVMPEHGNR